MLLGVIAVLAGGTAGPACTGSLVLRLVSGMAWLTLDGVSAVCAFDEPSFCLVVGRVWRCVA